MIEILQAENIGSGLINSKTEMLVPESIFVFEGCLWEITEM